MTPEHPKGSPESDRARAGAEEIDREMRILQSRGAASADSTRASVRRLVLTVATTLLVALLLWTMMR